MFHTRCPRRLPSGICEAVEPPLAEVAPGTSMRCHIPLEELRVLQTGVPVGAGEELSSGLSDDGA